MRTEVAPVFDSQQQQFLTGPPMSTGRYPHLLVARAPAEPQEPHDLGFVGDHVEGAHVDVGCADGQRSKNGLHGARWAHVDRVGVVEPEFAAVPAQLEHSASRRKEVERRPGNDDAGLSARRGGAPVVRRNGLRVRRENDPFVIHLSYSSTGQAATMLISSAVKYWRRAGCIVYDTRNSRLIKYGRSAKATMVCEET